MSAAQTFKAGDEVYDIHGRAGSYVARASSGHLVEPIYESDDEPVYSEVETWREVFAVPPTAKLHAEVAEIEKELTKRRDDLDALRTQQREVEAEAAAARKRVLARPDLVDFDLWLQGKVTHIVSLGYHGFSIGTVEETLRSRDRDRELRLLSLMVDPKANRYWTGYAAYSDGSSSQTRCLLATSLEHARERAADHIRQEIKAAPTQKYGALAASAIKYGVEVSSELRQQAADLVTAAAQHALDTARSQLARAQAEVAVAEARAKATGASA